MVQTPEVVENRPSASGAMIAGEDEDRKEIVGCIQEVAQAGFGATRAARPAYGL
jgi:hypothetical protein